MLASIFRASLAGSELPLFEIFSNRTRHLFLISNVVSVGVPAMASRMSGISPSRMMRTLSDSILVHSRNVISMITDKSFA